MWSGSNRSDEIKQEKQYESYTIKQKLLANFFQAKMGSCSRHIWMTFPLPHSHIRSLIRAQISCPSARFDRTKEEKLNPRGLQENTGQTTKHNTVICTCCSTTDLMQKPSKNIRHGGIWASSCFTDEIIYFRSLGDSSFYGWAAGEECMLMRPLGQKCVQIMNQEGRVEGPGWMRGWNPNGSNNICVNLII